MIKLKFIIPVFFIGISGYAQQTVPNLKPGDKMPDLLIPKLINSVNRTLKTADFKDRLLIVDFWATNCSGCVAALPKMEKLQKRFGNKVKILPVTYEDEKMVVNFWKKNSYTKGLTLSSVVNDKIFSAYFKHKSIPHEVWIYKGKVIGITTEEYVDAENISKVINGEKIDWPVKDDFYVFDHNKPLFTANENQIDTANTFMTYSAISDYKEGVNSEGLSGGSRIIRNRKKKMIRAYFLNQPIFDSYLSYLNKITKEGALVKPGESFSPNNVIWEVNDSSKYIYNPKSGYQQSWIRLHGICFESQKIDTGQTDEDVCRNIISDLNALLGLKVAWEKRVEKVLVLVGSATKNQVQNFSTANKSYSISTIIYNLNQQAGNPYIFNESKADDIKLNLDIKSWTDIVTIRNALRVYGYDLKEEQREVDKLVFKEINGGLLVDGQMLTEMQVRKSAQKDLKNPPMESNTSFLAINKKQKDVISLPSGLQYKILNKGTGAKPLADSKVLVNYIGTLVNGKIFDSSYEKGRSVEFSVNRVIKGWSEALQLMPVGAKWIIYIPPGLAYGERTAQGTVPPNSTLIFELELLKILP